MNYVWTSVATMTICLLCAAVLLYWGGQDQQGQFHAEYLCAIGNLGMSLFFLGPYALFVASSLLARRQRASLVVLMLTAVLCGIGVWAAWVDHEQYLNTPPGRGTILMLNFLATFALWLASVVMLAAVAISRTANLRSSQ